jgi:predicted nucleotidyltransferase
MAARNYESFAVESKPALTLSEVQRLSPIIRKIAASWGLAAVSLFGSVARNEATEQSDVDLLVTSKHGVSLSALSGFKEDMELLLRSEVDVLVRNVNSEVNNRIAAEAIEI